MYINIYIIQTILFFVMLIFLKKPQQLKKPRKTSMTLLLKMKRKMQ